MSQLDAMSGHPSRAHKHLVGFTNIVGSNFARGSQETSAGVGFGKQTLVAWGIEQLSKGMHGGVS